MVDFWKAETLEYSLAHEQMLPELRDISPEQKLWCAVICQAVCDAQNGCVAARTWLLFDGPDFVRVCSLAGIAPFALRNATRQFFKTKM